MSTALPPRLLHASPSHPGAPRPGVLVVEPDPSACLLFQACLTAAGFDVTAVGSASEALASMSPGRPLPALVISEVELSGKDGFIFCCEVKATPRTSEVPVLLLSRRDDPDRKERASGVGADDFLPKPLFAKDIVALARLRLAPRALDGAFRLNTETLPVPQLLRALLAGTRSGKLLATDGRAQVVFRRGRVIDASFDAHSGIEALLRTLALAEGEYTVVLGDSGQDAALLYGVRELVAGAFPALARWNELVSRGVPLEAVLAVDFSALTKALEGLPDEVNQVVRLFDGRRTVRQALIDTNLNEGVAFEVVTRLYAMGLITPAQTPAVERRRTARAPILLQRAIPSAIPTAPLQSHLGQQLEAFNIQMVIEARDGRPGEETLQRFARGEASEAETSAAADRPVTQPAGSLANLGAQASQVAASDLGPAEPLLAQAAFTAGPGLDPEADFFVEDATGTAVHSPGVPTGRSLLSVLAGVVGMALLTSGAGVVAWKLSAVRAPHAAPSVALPIVAPVPPRVVVPEAPPAEPLAARLVDPAPVAPRPALLSEGISLYTSGRAKEAASVLSRAVEEAPRSTEAWLMLGLARFDSLDNPGAEEAARKALAIDDRNGRAVMLLASIFLDQGQKGPADAQLRRYLELEPQGPFARDARQLLAAH